MEIALASTNDCEVLASIVSESNKDVADLLALNIDNAPKHPSFCTPEWIASDFERGQEYFLSRDKNMLTGCVAFEQADKDTAYLNRLSVLPEFRNRGLGSALVEHLIKYSKGRQVSDISIGIIAEHSDLKEWYLKRGFIEGSVQRFDHLPFNVLYMKFKLLDY